MEGLVMDSMSESEKRIRASFEKRFPGSNPVFVPSLVPSLQEQLEKLPKGGKLIFNLPKQEKKNQSEK